MTHVKKAEAFARLISFCTGYGGKYNPGNPNLQMDALVNQLNETQSVMELVKVAKTNFDNEANERKQIFEQLPYLVSSILRTLESSGAKPEKLDDARTFVQLISGRSPKNHMPIASGKEEKPAIQRSRLQLAFVSKTDAFSKLVKAVSTEPLYQPRESTLGQTGLEEKVVSLNQLNRKVANARALWSKAIIERNQVMYRNEVSMVKTAQAVKKYVRAIFGPSSAEYALLKSLDFNLPAKK